jgi:hypothetical protein
VKRRLCVCLVQALGLLCVAVALYLGWVQQLTADATAIREAMSAPQAAVRAAAVWDGFPGGLLFALRGPVFWLGLAIVLVAFWLPVPDSQGRRGAALRAPGGPGTKGPRRPSIAEPRLPGSRMARPSVRPSLGGNPGHALETRSPRV